LCYDAFTGENKWTTTICEGRPKFPVHPSNTYATETPIVNDSGVVAFFGATGTAAGISHDGQITWKQELGAFPTNNGFGTGSSVATFGNLAYVQHFTEDSAMLVAMDCKTGAKQWTHERQRKGSSWSSPIVWSNNQRVELVVSGGELIESLNPDNGSLLWSLTDVKAPTACSIAFDKQRIYFGGSDPMSKGPLFAVRAGAQGNLMPKKKNESFEFCDWLEKRAAPGMASPVSSGRWVFVTDNNVLRVYEVETGKKVQEKRLQSLSSVASSPILIDNKLLVLDEKGNCVLLQADADCSPVGSGKLSDVFWSTPAIDHDSLYLRGVDFLYCVRFQPGS
jgi:outer membrane protein assembly factor BamB